MTYSEVKAFNEKIYAKIEELNKIVKAMTDEEYDEKHKEYRAKKDALLAQLKDSSAITEKEPEQIEKEKETEKLFEKMETIDKKRQQAKEQKKIEAIEEEQKNTCEFTEEIEEEKQQDEEWKNVCEFIEEMNTKDNTPQKSIDIELNY